MLRKTQGIVLSYIKYKDSSIIVRIFTRELGLKGYVVNGARSGCQVFTYTPTQVKASVTGSGKADKRQIGRMIAKICGLSSPPEPADASDAVALAICHLWRGGAVEKIRKRAVS